MILGSHCVLIELWRQSRTGAINALKMVDLAGKDGIVSEFSPGVFVQVFIHLLLYFHHVAWFLTTSCFPYS